MNADTSTAHRHWDEQWRRAEGRGRWSSPEPWVAGTVGLLRERGVRRVLDLGCGVGRHAAFLADHGFVTVGADRSTAGIAHGRRLAAASGLDVAYVVAGFHLLPFADGVFDYVLAWNVVYHGDEEVVGAALTEIRRVLAPGGLYQATMLSKRNEHYGRGVEVSPNTFVQPDADDDKKHPHLYCDANDLLRLHRGMDLLTAFDADHGTEAGRAGNHHWHVLFEADRRAPLAPAAYCLP